MAEKYNISEPFYLKPIYSLYLVTPVTEKRFMYNSPSFPFTINHIVNGTFVSFFENANMYNIFPMKVLASTFTTFMVPSFEGDDVHQYPNNQKRIRLFKRSSYETFFSIDIEFFSLAKRLW